MMIHRHTFKPIKELKSSCYFIYKDASFVQKPALFYFYHETAALKACEASLNKVFNASGVQNPKFLKI